MLEIIEPLMSAQLRRMDAWLYWQARQRGLSIEELAEQYEIEEHSTQLTEGVNQLTATTEVRLVKKEDKK